MPLEQHQDKADPSAGATSTRFPGGTRSSSIGGSSSNNSNSNNDDPLSKVNKGGVGDSVQRLVQQKLGSFPRQAHSFVWVRNSSKKDGEDRSSQQSVASWSSDQDPSRKGSVSSRRTSQVDLEFQRAEPPRPRRKESGAGIADGDSLFEGVGSEEVNLLPSPSLFNRRFSSPRAGQHLFSVSDTQLYKAATPTDPEHLTFQEALESSPPPPQQPASSSEEQQLKNKETIISSISAAPAPPRRNSRSRIITSPFRPLQQYSPRSWLRPRRARQKSSYPDLGSSLDQFVQVTQEVTIEIQSDPDYRGDRDPKLNGEDDEPVVPRKPKEYPDFRTHHELFGGAPPSPTDEEEEVEDKSASAWKRKHTRFRSSVGRPSFRIQDEVEELPGAVDIGELEKKAAKLHASRSLPSLIGDIRLVTEAGPELDEDHTQEENEKSPNPEISITPSRADGQLVKKRPESPRLRAVSPHTRVYLDSPVGSSKKSTSAPSLPHLED